MDGEEMAELSREDFRDMCPKKGIVLFNAVRKLI
jgi:hypothetical protein